MVELMIVVAITGILAAIAIPNMIQMQLRAKRAELPMNVNGIKMAELGRDAAFDEFMQLGRNPRPDAQLDKLPAAWLTTMPEWELIGYKPDGPVRGNYLVELSTDVDIGFVITARSDLDDDDAMCEYTATKSQGVEITAIRAALF